MFIPPTNFKPSEKRQETKSLLRLQSSHLLISHEIVEKIFREVHNVYAVYYPNKKSLMLAPVTDELFKKLSQTNIAINNTQ